jgi:hypothetical protein
MSVGRERELAPELREGVREGFVTSTSQGIRSVEGSPGGRNSICYIAH